MQNKILDNWNIMEYFILFYLFTFLNYDISWVGGGKNGAVFRTPAVKRTP